MTKERCLIIWKEEKVAWITIEQTDMWYWDCSYNDPFKTSASEMFLNIITKLDIKKSFNNWSLGLEVEILYEGDETKKGNILILGFVDSILCVRTLTNRVEA